MSLTEGNVCAVTQHRGVVWLAGWALRAFSGDRRTLCPTGRDVDRGMMVSPSIIEPTTRKRHHE